MLAELRLVLQVELWAEKHVCEELNAVVEEHHARLILFEVCVEDRAFQSKDLVRFLVEIRFKKPGVDLLVLLSLVAAHT